MTGFDSAVLIEGSIVSEQVGDDPVIEEQNAEGEETPVYETITLEFDAIKEGTAQLCISLESTACETVGFFKGEGDTEITAEFIDAGLTVAPYDYSDIVFSVSDKVNENNGEATVYVSVTGNNGIRAMKLFLDFNSNALTLKSIAACGSFTAFAGGVSTNKSQSTEKGYLCVMWGNTAVSDTAPLFSGDGNFLKLVFSVNTSVAKSEQKIELVSAAPDNSANKAYVLDGNFIEANVTNGKGSVLISSRAAFSIRHNGEKDSDGNPFAVDNEETSVILSVDRNQGMKEMALTVSFDTSAMEYAGIAAPDSAFKTKADFRADTDNVGNGVIKVYWTSDKSVSATGDIIEITFRVKKDITGKYSVKYNDCSAKDKDGDNSLVSTSACEINVIEVDTDSWQNLWMRFVAVWNIFIGIITFNFDMVRENIEMFRAHK